MLGGWQARPITSEGGQPGSCQEAASPSAAIRPRRCHRASAGAARPARLAVSSAGSQWVCAHVAAGLPLRDRDPSGPVRRPVLRSRVAPAASLPSRWRIPDRVLAAGCSWLWSRTRAASSP